MKKLIAVVSAVAISVSVIAQTIPSTTLTAAQTAQLLLLLSGTNHQTVNINGQVITVAPNDLSTTTSGPAGSATTQTPTSLQDLMNQWSAMLAANQATNANFYTPGEVEVGMGGLYLQNSGQAVAYLEVEKWGITTNTANLGFAGGILQGNKAGQVGTAGEYSFVEYRKILGNVSVKGGIGGGYDNWNKTPFGSARLALEYRYNAHLGAEAGFNYAFEQKQPVSSGMMLFGGIRYAF